MDYADRTMQVLKELEALSAAASLLTEPFCSSRDGLLAQEQGSQLVLRTSRLPQGKPSLPTRWLLPSYSKDP